MGSTLSKNKIFLAGALIVISLSAVLWYYARVEQQGPEVFVRITSEGFSPEELTIQKNQKVTWINEDSEYHWPASNSHPTHEIYSEFDPDEPLGAGERWGFIFRETGEWNYHDHLRPGKTGIIRVQN